MASQGQPRLRVGDTLPTNYGRGLVTNIFSRNGYVVSVVLKVADFWVTVEMTEGGVPLFRCDRMHDGTYGGH